MWHYAERPCKGPLTFLAASQSPALPECQIAFAMGTVSRQCEHVTVT